VSVDAFRKRVEERHAAEEVRGEHDDDCEWGPRFYICNCSKRRREAVGFTEPPEEPLDFPPPSCPRCGRDLWHDGDGWQCGVCPLSWNDDGTGVRFTDDMGDLSRCAEHGIRAHGICQAR
jgi:hypothetical protein